MGSRGSKVTLGLVLWAGKERGAASGGAKGCWGSSRRRGLTFKPQSGLFDLRVHVESSEALRAEKQGVSWGRSSRRSSTFIPLSGLFDLRVYTGGSEELWWERKEAWHGEGQDVVCRG